MHRLGPLALFAAAAAAQTSVTLPTPAPVPGNSTIPFASGVGRYQQWFSPAQTANFGTVPLRIDQLQILAGANTTLATTVDIEISMAHAPAFGLTGQFDANFASPRFVCLPRTNVNLVTAAVGQPVLTCNFTQPFTWDSQRPVLVEARVFGNGRGNQSFNFDLRNTLVGFGTIVSVYQAGNPSAATGTVMPSTGLFMRFRTRAGAMVDFGFGCPGVNNVTPLASVTALAQPGLLWTHHLDNAAGQQICLFVLGTSNTTWGVVPLPWDMSPIGGAGCALLTDPGMLIGTTTAGGPGTGSASLSLQIPPLTLYVGVQLFEQWIVLDPAAPNAALSATAGVWSVIAPVGG